MSLQAYLHPQQQVGDNSHWLIPRDALIRKRDGTTLVWRINSSKLAEAIQLEVIAAMGEQLKVESAQLQVGDQLVVRGNENLRPGDVLQVLPASTKPLTGAQ